MKTILLLMSVMTFGLWTSAQNEFAQNWLFGDSINMDFSSATPVLTTNSGMFSYEGSVSHSDANGNLLFYSNGGDVNLQNDGFVWNANHQIMPNGGMSDTAGCQSAVQSSLVIPMPGSSTEYSLFTIDCLEAGPSSLVDHKGFRYSIIDMSLDGGLGDVTDKGIHIFGDPADRLAEGLTATRHANGTDYWILIHDTDQTMSTVFYVFLLNSSGISSPSVQSIGGNEGGQMKISVDGRKLAYGPNVFDFDNATGVISNPVTLPVNGYGRAFSPSNRYLYVSDGFDLYQYDLEAANIPASQVLLHSGNIFNIEVKGGMQLGPDCKIYVAHWDKNYIGVINNPDLGGTACSYSDAQVTVPAGTLCQQGMPSFVDSDFQTCDKSGVAENQLSNFKVYPTIAQESITIEIAELLLGSHLEVLDMSGKNLGTIKLENSTIEVDVSAYESGVYLLFCSETGQFQRFIKE